MEYAFILTAAPEKRELVIRAVLLESNIESLEKHLAKCKEDLAQIKKLLEA